MRQTLDIERAHRLATKRTMERMVRHCRKCERGQNPKKHDAGDGTQFWVCRYCQHEHKAT
jgi:hypothetical protein